MKVTGLECRERYNTLKDQDKLKAFAEDFLAGGVSRLGWEAKAEKVVIGNRQGDVLRITVGKDPVTKEPELLLEVV